MNDYHLDPPEEPELPECCDEVMECDDDGNCKCLTCGKTIDSEPDVEPLEPSFHDYEDDYTPPTPEHCPHGNQWGDCGTCDYESDIAYDAARERR